MHICEDAVKRLKTVGVYYRTPAFYFLFLRSQDVHHFNPLYPATRCCVFLLPASPTPFLSSHQAPQCRSLDLNLSRSLEHTVTLRSSWSPAPPTPPAERPPCSEISVSVQPVSQPSCSVASHDISTRFSCFSLVHQGYVKRKTCHISHCAVHFFVNKNLHTTTHSLEAD